MLAYQFRVSGVGGCDATAAEFCGAFKSARVGLGWVSRRSAGRGVGDYPFCECVGLGCGVGVGAFLSVHVVVALLSQVAGVAESLPGLADQEDSCGLERDPMLTLPPAGRQPLAGSIPRATLRLSS